MIDDDPLSNDYIIKKFVNVHEEKFDEWCFENGRVAQNILSARDYAEHRLFVFLDFVSNYEEEPWEDK